MFGVQRAVELHCHCLPGLDDGPKTAREAMDLCLLLASQGVTDVVATPHQLGQYDGRNSPAIVRRAVRELRDQLALEKVPLNVLPGGDVRLDERIPQLLAADRILSVADAGHYILLELIPQIPIDPQDLLITLVNQKVIPIITHPERLQWLAQSPQWVARWLHLGAGIQITSGALIGDFGSQTQAAAWRMLAMPGLVMVASDAHNTTRRPPRLPQAAEAIAQRFGWEAAKRLCVEAPMRILQTVRTQPAAPQPTRASVP